MYFLNFSLHFDRDRGLDQGRLCLRHLEKGTVEIWTATSSTSGKQDRESFHKQYGLIPPEYRVPGLKSWQVHTQPINLSHKLGVQGNFYKIDPHEVKTDKGGVRGDFGIHKDANVPGSLGCIVLTAERFNDFEKEMSQLSTIGVDSLPLFVTYS
ncbi:MAG: hypothetical protein ACFB2X_11565 [Rivularia sp. (in: cyanobacteria)]